MDPKSLFSLSDHLEALSKEGDPLEILQQTVDFEFFRAWLVEGLGYGVGAKGGNRFLRVSSWLRQRRPTRRADFARCQGLGR